MKETRGVDWVAAQPFERGGSASGPGGEDAAVEGFARPSTRCPGECDERTPPLDSQNGVSKA
jgi:hypothetical protein